MAAYGEIRAVRIILNGAPSAKLLDRFFKKITWTMFTLIPIQVFFFKLLQFFSADLWPFKKRPFTGKVDGRMGTVRIICVPTV